MTHRAEEISNYQFKSSDKLLVDTNIWLLVHAPQKPGDSRVAVYSNALYDILAAQSRIYIDVLIVSEFITQYARLKHQLIAPKIKFKDFRKSQDFKPVAQDVAADIKRVLKHCTLLENNFDPLAINALIDKYSMGDSDFNDQVLATLCKNKGLKLVTDDGDFKGCGIPVVTANKRLFA
ncbi:MAG: PIN domain-containing protein [Methylococcales bacterium]